MRNLPLSRQRLSTGISASMTDIGMKRIDLGIYRTVGPVKPGREQACAGSVDCCRVLCRPRVIYRLAYSCVRTRVLWICASLLEHVDPRHAPLQPLRGQATFLWS